MRTDAAVRIVAVGLILLSGMMHTACAPSAGGSSARLGTPAAQPAALNQLELPRPDQLPRNVSAAPVRVFPGSWFAQLPPYSFHLVTAFSGQAQFQPNYDLQADPPQSDFAYCMYDFNVQGLGAQPAALRYGWQLPPGAWSNLWWGLANWSTNSWDWFAATGVSPQALGVPALDDYIAGDGRVVLVALMLGTAEARLHWIAIGGNLPPIASFEIDPPNPSAGEPVSFTGASSMDYDGSILKYEYDFGEGAGFEDFGALNSASHTYTAAGQYSASLRVTDDGGLTDTDSIVIDVGAAPHGVIASLSADPPGGSPILTIEFDASASLPSTGATITSYDFDFDGDGASDQFGVHPVGQSTYYWGGNYTASVTVTDDALQSDTVALPLALADSRTWHVDFETTCCGSFILFEVQGRPALGFITNDQAQLCYVRASDISGTAWPAPILIDIMGPFQGRMDAAMIDGTPALAYLREVTATQIALRYAHSSIVSGMNEGAWSASAVDNLGYVDINAHAVTMIPVGTNAGLAYWKRSPDAVYYTRSQDPDGATWITPINLAACSNMTYYPVCATLMGGQPAVVYPRQTSPGTTGLYLRQASDADGDTWVAEQAVYGQPNYVYGPGGLSFSEQGGLSAITALQTNSGNLYFLYPSDVEPGQWASVKPFTSSYRAGKYCTWTMLAGHPAVAGFDSSLNSLLFTRALDALGTAWPTSAPSIIAQGDAEANDVGKYVKLLVLDNTPMAAYFDSATGMLRFAVLR